MRQTRDSFLHLFIDNIVGVPVKNVRRDVNNPAAALYQVNALNIKFLDEMPGTNIGCTTVELAVINEDELTALDWVNKVYIILNAAYLMQKMDYTNPTTPVAVGQSQIWWDYKLSFKPVYSEMYYDYRCQLDLYHKVDS